MKTLVDGIGPDNIVRCYSFDATYHRLYSGVVNISNWAVAVRTQGGHSLGAYGTPNAIEELSKVIHKTADLCRGMIEQNGLTRTTFNVGTFHGGVRNNLIAEQAEMSLEFRSDEEVWCERMKDYLQMVVRDYEQDGVEIFEEPVGNPPLWSKADSQVMQQLEQEHLAIMHRLGLEPKVFKAATDCRYPMHKGIPSLCLGLCLAGNPHSREEYLEQDSLPTGLELLLTIFNSFLNSN